MRSVIKKESYGSSNIMKFEKKQAGWKNVLLYGAIILLLFIFQEISGRVGGFIADMFSYGKFDPYNAYAGNSVHHTI